MQLFEKNLKYEKKRDRLTYENETLVVMKIKL